MDKPTRGQWRGYAVMVAVLAAVLLALIFYPRSRHIPEPVDHSRLKKEIGLYGDSMLQQSEREHWQYRNRYKQNRGRSYDTARQEYRHERHPRPAVTVELNGADTATLQMVYGIGPIFSTRIVKYRTMLGGFVRKEQLLEVYGITEERYREIEPQITVDASLVDKIDINNATLAQLRRHPYLDYYQAKAIVDYRNMGNTFSSMDDLLKVNLLDANVLEKLQGYIQF